MAQHTDYPKTRLFVEHSLSQAQSLTLDENAAHYVRDVLRMKAGDKVALFNGKDGEWLGEIADIRKKEAVISCASLLRPQAASPDAWLLAAPLKAGRHEDVAVKCTELGICAFAPVLTQFSVADKVNPSRLRKLLIEAAEQSERLDVPQLYDAKKLSDVIGSWPEERILFYADESGGGKNISELNDISGAFAVLIGPEGGFSTAELQMLKGLKFAQAITLGPRILKADTAAIAAVSCLMARYGDWQHKPAFRALG